MTIRNALVMALIVLLYIVSAIFFDKGNYIMCAVFVLSSAPFYSVFLPDDSVGDDED